VLIRKDHIPWKDITVIITKQSHPCKGHRAVVENVLCNQEDTASGLRVMVRYENYDPNVPFAWQVFDYDDVLEYKYVSQYFSSFFS
jgi:hypothetical protein